MDFSLEITPVVGTIYLRAKGEDKPRRAEVKLPPTLRAGDKGGLRRLEKELPAT